MLIDIHVNTGSLLARPDLKLSLGIDCRHPGLYLGQHLLKTRMFWLRLHNGVPFNRRKP
jgi:hypothetical protein